MAIPLLIGLYVNPAIQATSLVRMLNRFGPDTNCQSLLEHEKSSRSRAIHGC